MLEVKNLSYHYKGSDEVLHNISFSLEDGSFLAILGNNGVGKSTLLKCFNNILTPDKGEIIINGENILTLSHRERAKQVALVSQNIPSLQMTVHDTVMLGRRPYFKFNFSERDHEIVHATMRRLGLEQLRGRFLNELSGGERQKVMLARALSQEPKLLLLDEPTSSLDIKNQYQVLNIVKELCESKELSAIMVIHDLSLALRFANNFLLLKDGEIYRYGGYDALDSVALRAVYGVNGRIIEVENKRLVLVEE